MSAQRALFVTVSLHDVVVDEVQIRPGVGLEVGPRGDLKIPVPEGVPWACKVSWAARGTVAVVEDGAGAVHQLGLDDALDVTMGPVRVHLSMVRQFAIRRTQPVAWMFSLAWFLTMFASALGLAQVEAVWSQRCVWFGIDCPETAQAASGVNAEYLVRLLREDFDGQEDGVVASKPRPAAPTVLPSAYLPSGNPYGDKREMGGAELVDREVVKAPPKPKERLPAAPAKRRVRPEPSPVGTPIVAPEVPEDQAEGDALEPDGVVQEPDEEDDDAPAAEEAVEDREGFGLADWLDMTPEERLIERMLDRARGRLRIDPNDPEALSLLAYYQYLADDLDGAEATYDKIIDVEPESAAAYNNKALIYKRRREFAKEEGLYRVALALEPDDTTAMNNLAVNLSHQGKHMEALAIMERLAVELPDDPYSDLHRAKIYAEMGQEEKAFAFLESALAGMQRLDTLHHIEFRQDIRVDPSFSRIRDTPRFRGILRQYYGENTPLQE